MTIAGPFGEFFAKETAAEMVFVGGGAGMAPMALAHLRSVSAVWRPIAGSASGTAPAACARRFYIEDFDAIAAEHDNFAWHLALSEPLPEDNWTGMTGFIHQVLYDNYLKGPPRAGRRGVLPVRPAPMMLKACMDMLDSLGVEKDNILFDDFG